MSCLSSHSLLDQGVRICILPAQASAPDPKVESSSDESDSSDKKAIAVCNQKIDKIPINKSSSLENLLYRKGHNTKCMKTLAAAVLEIFIKSYSELSRLCIWMLNRVMYKDIV